MALAGCGDSDDSSGEKSSGGSEASSEPKAASHATVLECLKGEGLEAEDQTNSSGKKIGIDYPAGRLVISFQQSAEEAETYASVAKTNGEGTIVMGKVVATIPVDPGAQSAEDTIKGCL
ncbi:MAG TPA: hypothetical protein VEX39_16150 [Thermoleophilaceae bacterium]|nr:hypothetical protein [Thermoleophilaceae bacterium]